MHFQCLNQIFFKIFKTIFLVLKNNKVQKQKKACKMNLRKINQSTWKFQGHIFRRWIMSLQIFRKIHAHISYNIRGPYHVHSRGTARRTGWIQYTPRLPNFVCGGYKKIPWLPEAEIPMLEHCIKRHRVKVHCSVKVFFSTNEYTWIKLSVYILYNGYFFVLLVFTI